jgi:hypothetical protein
MSNAMSTDHHDTRAPHILPVKTKRPGHAARRLTIAATVIAIAAHAAQELMPLLVAAEVGGLPGVLYRQPWILPAVELAAIAAASIGALWLYIAGRHGRRRP